MLSCDPENESDDNENSRSIVHKAAGVLISDYDTINTHNASQ